jgi:hypothetical protein
MQHVILLFLAIFLAGGVHAQEKFQRKSGLWELKRTSTVTREQPRIYQMCVDEASDNALSPLADGVPGEVCDVSNLKRGTGKLSLDATCKIRQTAVVAKTSAVISGKFDSAYKVESKTTFTPELRGHPESTAVLEAKWTGPCKAGQRPGDVVGPSGAKFNVAEQGAAHKDAKRDKAPKNKRGRYAPASEAAPSSSDSTPAVPPFGTQPK